MIDGEALANYAVQNSGGPEKVDNVQVTSPPKPPKRGELIYCQWCGKPMYPQDFSKDPKIRKREFKWQIHYACEQKIWDFADRQTPGLLGERQGSLGSANSQVITQWVEKQQLIQNQQNQE